MVGLGAAAAVARVMRTLLFGVSPLDPLRFAVVPLTLATVARPRAFYRLLGLPPSVSSMPREPNNHSRLVRAISWTGFSTKQFSWPRLARKNPRDDHARDAVLPDWKKLKIQKPNENSKLVNLEDAHKESQARAAIAASMRGGGGQAAAT